MYPIEFRLQYVANTLRMLRKLHNFSHEIAVKIVKY